MRSTILLAGLTLAAVSCSKPSTPASAPESALATSPVPLPAADRPIDPCSLLTSDEIQAVMGEAVREAKTERQEAGGFVISHCYFSLPTTSSSVVLRLIQPGSGEDRRSPRQAWEETFAKGSEKTMGEQGEAGGRQPEKVAGVGDSAYWLGGPKTGGLYVLKGDRYFRLGVGGEPNQPSKIEKASALAKAILSKLEI